MKGRLVVFPTPDALVEGSARAITDLLVGALNEGGIATLLLSGGETPRKLYRQLGMHGLGDHIDWKRVHLFWGDERCVPPSHPESNYLMVKQTLLSYVGLPETNVHRIETERQPDEAAGAYELEIRQFFNLPEGEIPMFDLILLGLGEDGHTASLFPGGAAVDERKKL